ncbi:MAG: hypothetical protein AAF715_01590 [Myxococcota bacterium]
MRHPNGSAYLVVSPPRPALPWLTRLIRFSFKVRANATKAGGLDEVDPETARRRCFGSRWVNVLTR